MKAPPCHPNPITKNVFKKCSESNNGIIIGKDQFILRIYNLENY